MDRESPTYVLSYPRPVRLVRGAAILILIAGAVANWALAWVRFARPAVEAALAAPGELQATLRLVLDQLAAQPLRPLLAAHLGLLLAAWSAVIVADLLPDLALADDGLAVRRLRRWTVVPWATIRTVRAVPLEGEHYLVLVQGSWTRLAAGPRLASLLMGAGAAPGVLLHSAIRDFVPLMERLYQEVAAAAPEAVFEDDFASLPAALVLSPAATLATLAGEARDEGWPLARSLRAMAAVSAGLALVQLLVLILQGGAWWKPLAILALCAIEWLIGALYLYALAELLPGSVEFRPAALLYPLAQIPRALVALPMAMFFGAGLGFVAAVLGLAGVLWAVVLTTLVVQQLYRLPSVLPAVPGALFQTFYQFLVLAILFTR